MAVVYETGIATSPSDLLTKLITFATANGWTVNTPTSGKVFINGSILCGVKDNASDVQFRGGVTYAAGSAWDAQTGAASNSCSINTGSGPFSAYHFYSGTEGASVYLQGVVEISAGIYRHFFIGTLVKFGTYTGGEYVDASYHDQTTNIINNPASSNHNYICDQSNANTRWGHVRTSVDARANTFSGLVNLGNQTATSASGDVRGAMTDNLFSVGYARWNLRTILEPMRVYVVRPSSLRSTMGRIPNMRLLNLVNFSAGEEFAIGGDTWKAFPVFARQTGAVGSTTPSSGLYGYAYLMP